MRKEDLYIAIGQLDEELLATCENGWRPSRVWKTVLTTAACLVLVLGIGGAMLLSWRGDAVPWSEMARPGQESQGDQDMAFTEPSVTEPNAGVEEISWNQCAMLTDEDGVLYYSAYTEEQEPYRVSNAAVWRYDPETGASVRLGDFQAGFTRAQSGNYCTDQATGDVYELDGATLTKVGTMPEDGVLIGVLGETIYYYKLGYNEDYSFAFCRIDSETGREREWYRCTDSGMELQDCYMRDWMIYYRTTYRTADPAFYSLNLNTGENRWLEFEFPKGALYHVSPCGYYDDCIIIGASFYENTGEYSLYRLDYDTLEVTALTQPETTIVNGFHRQGDKLFWDGRYQDGQQYQDRLTEYDLMEDTITEWDEEIPGHAQSLCVYSGGFYYHDARGGIYYYDRAAGITCRIDTAVVDSETDDPQNSDQDAEKETFFEIFHELDRDSMQDYIMEHPEVLENGWRNIDINESGLEDTGTGIRTSRGDQVLAVNAKDGVLLIRVEFSGIINQARGVLAICKDTSQLSLCPAETLGTIGQTVGQICEDNDGVLAITGSAFVDSEGSGNGGTLSGLMVSGGVTYGTSLGGSYKRLELRNDNKMYIVDSYAEVDADTRDAVEFMPAVIVDGEVIVGTGWDAPQPRAVIGQSDRLETMMIVAEGRFVDSIGCGVEEIAEVMKEYGCVQAMNLDGGTSAMMYYKGQYVTRCSNSYHPEGRTLPSAWVYHKGAEFKAHPQPEVCLFPYLIP